jgi:hypothetical protein
LDVGAERGGAGLESSPETLRWSISGTVSEGLLEPERAV